MHTRTETRTRLVPHTIDGTTRMVEETYTAHVPTPPRDWDRIVLTSASAGAAFLVAASVIWSTTSIGDLLNRAAPAPVAYLAALAYDATWITCMALEWLARYDPARARGPRIAGHLALAVAMAAVAVHGWVTGSAGVGLVGAVVSALAKGLWTLVLRHTAQPLDRRTEQWLIQRRGEVSAQLALSAQLRQLARVEEQHAALRAAAPQRSLPAPDTDTDEDRLSGPGVRASGTVRSAVRATADTLPDASAGDITDHLARVGIDTDEDTVRAILDADTGTGGQQDSRSDAVVRPFPPGGHRTADTVADTVRTALASGIRDTDTVLSVVRRTHGPDVKRETVARTIRRYDRTA